MKLNIILLSVILAASPTACTTPENKKHEAEAEYLDEKTDTLKDYKECVKTSEGAEDKMKQCDALLKAVKAVEGTK